MTRDKLQTLIDRVIGKKGIMRAPSYWVRRLFNEVIAYCEGLTPKIEVDTEMSDKSGNAVSNKVIKGYVDGLVGDVGSVIDAINGEEV